MTILEVLDKQNNKDIYLKFLGELLWQSDLHTYELLDKFVNMEASEKVINSINSDKFYWELGMQIWDFYGKEYPSFVKKIIKKLDDDKLVELAIKQNPRHIIFNYFSNWKYECFIKHIENKVLY